MDWTSQPPDTAAVEQLAADASARHLLYLFPFTTYVREDGFSPSYTHAAEFTSAFRRFNRETYLLAWVGIPLEKTGITGIDGWTDLSDEKQRIAITNFIAELVAGSGFDGVHLNAETVWDGDSNYLLLLDEIRETLGSRYILSVAAPSWRSTLQPSWAGDHRWSSGYYYAVAIRVDQIVTMTYDSLTIDPHSYQLWLAEQVGGISTSLADSGVELLIGVSVSRETTFTHYPEAENLQSGLEGICAALRDLPQGGDHVEGVSIYAAWEADTSDWQAWEDWLKSSSP